VALRFTLNLKVGANYQTMTRIKMADPMDDIAKQARQGSVAAIIQVLNEKLAEAGVRTRAILAEGILQLLCEAGTAEQLEQSVLVAQIRQILEAIAPRNIRRVNINSRLVREQQLLWLEEISREPENLLWSEQIILNKPGLLKQLAEDLKSPKPPKAKPPLPKSTNVLRENRQFRRGIIGGASLSLFLLLVGWAISHWLGTQPNNSTTEQKSQVTQKATTPPPTSDPFAEAVRLAEKTSVAGQTAQTSAQWLDIAAKWQQASDLMATVPSTDGRYKTAQNRRVLYRQYSDSAQAEAQRRRS
jgi:hypothetical protein